MRLKKGDSVTNIVLPAIDGTEFNLESLQGKRYMLSFFRFASCPFCNLR
ncbi:MAG TPA: redoxin domain-containing protein, partial [Aeromonadales bacterium]|nr:redoxin domain-containing protein [Aeromonadales bacterium]